MIQKDEGKQNKVGGHKGRRNFCIRNKLKNNFKNLQKKPRKARKEYQCYHFCYGHSLSGDQCGPMASSCFIHLSVSI